VTCDMVVKEGGSFINKYYNGSLKRGTDESWVIHSDFLISIKSYLSHT
jgi:hypothetical protein